MNAVTFLTSAEGRLAPKPFALGVIGVWVAGIASQFLLTGEVMARVGVWPFIAVQAALIWIWLALHIRRLRDAGQGAAGVIGVTAIYVLSIGLLLLLVAFFTHPEAIGESPAEGPPRRPIIAVLLVVFLFNILFTPDFGVFSTIFKGLILIAFVPAIISLLFSIRTGMRASAP